MCYRRPHISVTKEPQTFLKAVWYSDSHNSHRKQSCETSQRTKVYASWREIGGEKEELIGDGTTEGVIPQRQ